MNARTGSLVSIMAWGSVATLLLLAPVRAADPPTAARPSPVAKTATPAAKTAQPPAIAIAAKTEEAKDKSLREQTIYVPYEKLRQVFEQHGRGVFLPYEKFQELWQAAHLASARPAAAKPPVGAVITAIDSEATAANAVVRVRARLSVEVLAEGWQEIPLRLGDSAITAATVGHDPARILGDPQQGYRLLVEKKGKTAETLEVTLEYAKAITKAPGQNSVEFEAPVAPVSRWQVRIPESGVKVNIQPLVAVTEAPAEKPHGKAPEHPAEETVVLAFVGAARSVHIDWTPKAEGATGMEALASVAAEQQLSIGEGVARTHAKLTYAISRAQLAQLAVEVPADQKVVNVLDANVRQWSVQAAGKVQKITVQLFEPAKATQSLAIDLERFSAGQPAAARVEVPVIKALGVGRQQGVVVIEVSEGLRAEALQTTGLLQLDRADLPAALRRGGWAFSYRYAALPFELSLGIEKVQPRVLVDSLLEVYLEPERLSLDWTVLYHIERAGLFQAELELPEGYEVRRVEGRPLPGAQGVSVDAFHVEGPKKNRLVVNLARKAIGDVALDVQLERPLQEPSLLTPGDKSAELSLAVPRAAAGTVQHSSGKILVYAPPSLRVNPGKLEGLRAIAFHEALMPVPSARETRLPLLEPVLAFAHTGDSALLAVAAERRKPQITIGQLLGARIEDGVVKYKATFFYQVLYSGVKSLRIDVPKEVAPRLHNNTRGVAEKEIVPAPKDVAPDCVAWSLTGESELLGSGRIDLSWEEERGIGKLEIGKSVELNIPRLQPREVDRAWGQIVLSKAETIDLAPSGEPKGLRPIDPQHDLMPGAAVSGAAAAFEFHGDWSLAIIATRYQLEEVKHTSIERALVRMVVTPAGQVSVQASYRMRSGQQRLELVLPKDVQFDTEPLWIDGRSVTLERGKEGQMFVPLVSRNPDEPFLLELRYTLPGDGSRLDLPQFPREPAVQKVYLCVYIPFDRVLLAKSGPWTDEFEEGPCCDRGTACVVRHDEDSLRQWVLGGKQLPGETSAKGFHTDGKLYLFSTLEPKGPPDGSLGLVLLGEKWLDGLVLGLIVLLGVLLVPAAARTRLLAAGLLLIALAICGLFWPLAASQIAGPRLGNAVLIVAVIWTVLYCGWSLPRLCRTWTCCRKSPGLAAAAPPTDVAATAPPAEPAPPTPGDQAGAAPSSEGGPSHE